MTDEMRRTLARLPYEEKLQRVAELIEFSRRFKAAKIIPQASVPSNTSEAASSDAVDPVLAEVYRAKKALAERYNYDLRAMAQDARARQGRSGHEVVARSIKRSDS